MPALASRGLAPQQASGMTIAEFFQLAEADAPLATADEWLRPPEQVNEQARLRPN